MDAPVTRIEAEVFADTNVFFLLADNAPPPDLDTGWVDEVIATQIAARPKALCIGTARCMPVPVSIEIQPTAPADEDLDAWDHVTQASIVTATGRLRLLDGMQEPVEGAELTVPAGTYLARASIAGIATISDDALQGQDHYRVVLWPGPPEQARVIKEYPEMPGG